MGIALDPIPKSETTFIVLCVRGDPGFHTDTLTGLMLSV